MIGHSLGGMLAALLAAENETLSAAVNLDGHGNGTPDLYDGMEPSEAEARLTELLRLANPGQPPALSKEMVAEARVATAKAATEQGLSAELAVAMVDRGLAQRPDGTFRVRPDADVVADILSSIEALELLTLYDRTTVPLLVYNARALTDAFPGAPSWVPDMIASYRRDLARALSDLSARNPLVSYQEIETGHGIHLEQPELVAEQIRAFLETHRDAGPLTRPRPGRASTRSGC